MLNEQLLNCQMTVIVLPPLLSLIEITTIFTLSVSYHHLYPHVPSRRQYDWTGFGSRPGQRTTWESPSSSCLMKVTSSKALNEDKQTPGQCSTRVT